jgi:hypothetical protein
MEVTDDKAWPKDERKRKQIESAAKKSSEAKLIQLADKTGNHCHKPCSRLVGRATAGICRMGERRDRVTR